MLTPQPHVLLTGFDAFGDVAHNPSWLVAQVLDGRQIGGHQVLSAQLPTAFGASWDRLTALMKLHRPGLVICLGLASGRSAISLERIAINVNDARIADNAHAQPIDTPVVPGGPAAYFTGLPVKAMLQAVRDAGVAAELSNTAGTFVCNHVFYALMHRLETGRGFKQVRGGFIHLPCLPEQADASGATASMALDDMVRGIEAAIGAALAYSGLPDLAVVAGTIS